MPPALFRSGGKYRRRLLFAFAFAAAAVLFGSARLGRFMTAEDTLTKADAIFVLAGTRIDRPMEAADLYRAGYAPAILVTRALAEPGAFRALQARGIHVPSDFDLSRDVLRSLGVPEQALVSPDRIHDNTAEEAETLRQVAMERRWRRVIVVTSKYHLRRTSLACHRALRGTGVDLVMRGSRYDPADPDHWWRHRSDLRWMASEVPKLVAYALGAGA